MLFKLLMRQTATVYHKLGEDVSGRGIYERYVLNNVRFESKESVKPTNEGYLPYNTFKLYINTKACSDKIYAEKNAFEVMSDAAKDRCWTVSEGDMITSGKTAFSLTEESVDEIKGKCEIFTVNSITKDCIGKTEILELSGRGRVYYR